MKKILVFIISLIMMLFAIGCMNNTVDSLPINPDSSNSSVNKDEDTKNSSSNSSVENGESSKNDGEQEENDDSSSNNNENESSNGSGKWTDFR